MLREGVDDVDDEDEDPDVRAAMKDKRQIEFERKNKAKIDQAEKAATLMDLKTVDANVEKAAKELGLVMSNPLTNLRLTNPKRMVMKRRGRKSSGDSKSGKALAWLRDNPGAKRGDSSSMLVKILRCHTTLQMLFIMRLNGNCQQLQHSRKHLLAHGVYEGMYLGENNRGWADSTNSIVAAVFESLAEAEAKATEIADWYQMDVKGGVYP